MLTIEVTEAEIADEADKYALQQVIYSQGKVKKEEIKAQLLQNEYFMLYRGVQRRKVYSILRDKIDVLLDKNNDEYQLVATHSESKSEASEDIKTSCVPVESEGKEVETETTVTPIEPNTVEQGEQ